MSNVKFIYVRTEPTPIVNSLGVPEKDKDGNVKMHKGFPIGCFAYRFITINKGGKDVGKSCQYGYSVFNPNDEFDRETARVVAHYRLLTDNRANYASLSQHNNDVLATMLAQTAETEIHQWAKDDNGHPINLNKHFRRACARMSDKMASAIIEQRNVA